MSITDCNSPEGKMGRTKGAINKAKVQAVYALTSDERLEIIARLLVELISEELCTES